MKNYIKRFKKIIRFMVSIFSSREFAFIYCLAGTAAQVTHTYFLTASISSFSGGFKFLQAFLISFFISSSLLYFVTIFEDIKDEETNKRSKESRRILLAINIFMIIEILINFYYYARHLIIDSPQLQVFDFIFAVLVSCLLPITIKLYANSIRAKEWLEEFEDKKEKIIEEEKSVALNEDFKALHEKVVSFEYAIETLNTTITQRVDNDFDNWLEKNNLDKAIPNNFEEELQIHFSEFLSKINPDTLISEKQIENIIDRFKSSLDSNIADIFLKNQQLFLQQFQNKCQVFINKNIKVFQEPQLVEEAKIETSEN